MKVVVAPNSFKGSLSATQAARAIGLGVLQALPDAQIVEVPVADGGDGTAEALVTAHHGTLQWVNVEGPLGDTVHASYGQIDGGRVDPGWREIEVLVACDVTNPLLGPQGASHVYGPQKGADDAMVELLDRALAQFAMVVERDLGKQVADVPGAGAAGGTGAGLIAFLGAKLVRGAPLVVQAAGLDQALKGADLVITGEGRIDAQTAFGKAPGEVARRAQAAGVRVLFLAGTRGPG